MSEKRVAMIISKKENLQSHFSGEACSAGPPLAADLKDGGKRIERRCHCSFGEMYSELKGVYLIVLQRLLWSLLLQIFYSGGAASETPREQTAVEPVVVACGDGDGRGGMNLCCVQQESRAFAERRDRGGILPDGRRKRGVAAYVGDEHLTVDGHADSGWAGQKIFRRKDAKGKPAGAGGEADLSRGEAKEPDPRKSMMDPDALRSKKSKGG